MADTEVSLAIKAGQATLQYGQYKDALTNPIASLGYPENSSAEMPRIKAQDLVEKSKESFSEAILHCRIFSVTIREDGSHQKEKTQEDLADLSSRHRVLSTLEFEWHLTVSYKKILDPSSSRGEYKQNIISFTSRLSKL